MNNAIADISTLIPQYKSKSEEAWASDGWLYMEDLAMLDARQVHQQYEPLRFYLEGGSYLPDFMHLFDDGRIVFVEVKGSKKQRGYTSSRQKLRAAAKRYPFFTWVQAVGGRNGFEVEVLNG